VRTLPTGAGATPAPRTPHAKDATCPSTPTPTSVGCPSRRARSVGPTPSPATGRPPRTLLLAPRPGRRGGDPHLEAENAYTEALFEPLGGLQERLFEEIRSRILETDASPPQLQLQLQHGAAGGTGEDASAHPWLYYVRTVKGQQYAIHCRRPAPTGVSRHP
jgi:hypothetical protein